MADLINEATLTDLSAVPYKLGNAALWNASVTATNNAIVDLAQELGVVEADIGDPLHTAVADYGRFFFYERLFSEVAFVADGEIEEDKYNNKARAYYAKMSRKKKDITPEMMLKVVANRGGRVREVVLFRT